MRQKIVAYCMFLRMNDSSVMSESLDKEQLYLDGLFKTTIEWKGKWRTSRYHLISISVTDLKR